MVLAQLIVALALEKEDHVLFLRLQTLLKQSHRFKRVIDVVELVANLSDAQVDLLLQEFGVDLSHTV